ncbi:MAG: hypothetical protein DRO12_04785 [Thermoprotei archaeon]|nr:MAG: hypothetical protein DRO12_04785 [Thermoprotei archaeon]
MKPLSASLRSEVSRLLDQVMKSKEIVVVLGSRSLIRSLGYTHGFAWSFQRGRLTLVLLNNPRLLLRVIDRALLLDVVARSITIKLRLLLMPFIVCALLILLTIIREQIVMMGILVTMIFVVLFLEVLLRRILDPLISRKVLVVHELLKSDPDYRKSFDILRGCVERLVSLTTVTIGVNDEVNLTKKRCTVLKRGAGLLHLRCTS